jgi:hypothetical protein
VALCRLQPLSHFQSADQVSLLVAGGAAEHAGAADRRVQRRLRRRTVNNRRGAGCCDRSFQDVQWGRGDGLGAGGECAGGGGVQVTKVRFCAYLCVDNLMPCNAASLCHALLQWQLLTAAQPLLAGAG